MLAPAVLPFQITLAVYAVALISIGALLRKNPAVLAITVLMSFLLFIPTCIGIGFIVDAFRYGQFEYATAHKVNDPYVEIPKHARSITLHKYASGHEVRFVCEPDELTTWMEGVHARRLGFAASIPFELDQDQMRGPTRERTFESHFNRHGWSMPDDVVCYKGWRSARGSGFDVWYSPSSKTGFIRSSYW